MQPNTVKITIIFSLAAIILLGAGCVLFQPKNNARRQQSVANVTNDERKKLYENKELGFAFAYPAEFGEVILEKGAGETGNIYSGKFTVKSDIIFGGLSVDYTAGTDFGTISFNQGFQKKLANRYELKYGPDINVSILNIEPLQTLYTADNEEILVFDASGMLDYRDYDPETDGGMGGQVSPEGKAAVINLKGNIYKSITFELLNATENKEANKQFIDILESIKVTSPE
ncbi:MAG: hypothetical protein HYV42_03205 [Candidatus Magasanikbacteria bacterium]|nr:hypothetical protein [Candidatus Magasanikbacteria bacterium]